ncbi:MAG: M23 family metallopeptidase [Bacteroidota bacterium]
MADKNKKTKNQPTKYRLVVMNDDTFEEVGSYRLSLFNVYSAVSTVLVFVVIFVVCIIIFTPLKRYIPGYGSNMRSQVKELYDAVDSLDREIADRNFYIENIRKVLTGELETAEKITENAFLDDTIRPIEPIQEDLDLRDKVARDEVPSLPLQVNFKPDTDILELKYMVPPVNDGFITDEFMPDKEHYGIDIAAAKNTPIKAILDGKVILSDWTMDTGYIIGIQHKNNLLSFYKHNSVLLKKVNSFVKAGEAIAIIGNTGHLSDGPHLHFELWLNGQVVDPAEFINF